MADPVEIVLAEIRGLRQEQREHRREMNERLAHLEQLISKDLERRLDKLERGEAHRKGMSIGAGVAGGGTIAAIIEAVRGLL